MEKETAWTVWYRLRGLGLLCLCSFVFFAGAYLTNQKSVAVSGNAQERLLPVSSVQSDGKKIALTFDADWDNDNTQTILNILDKYGVKATFFVTGRWADKYPEDVKRIAAAGHDLGNHSQSHNDMGGMKKSEMQNEIQTLHTKVQSLTGLEMNLFRAPYGIYDEALLQTVKMSGYLPIHWDIDSEDWKNYGIESIISTVSEGAEQKNGSIILMHNEADYITQALEGVITSLQSQGYELVPVSQMIYWSNYYIDDAGHQAPSQSVSGNSFR